MESIPYVSFYSRHHISPVRQDITDPRRHFDRRAALYRHLGIVPSSLRDRAVLEFGPGTGHNSLFTLACRPSQYVLVDANDKSIEDLRANLGTDTEGSAVVEIVQALFEDYSSDHSFDFVLAEGCIPWQTNPVAALRTIARHVTPGGVLIITCTSATSYLSETIRRLIRDRMLPASTPPDEQLHALRPIMEDHLKHLPGRSRLTDDWILDSIVQPFSGRLMPVDVAVDALKDDFDVYSTSPRFFTDMRWYKDVASPDNALTAAVIDQYHANAINFLDYRLALPAHDPALGVQLESLCQAVWAEMQTLEGDDLPGRNAFERVLTTLGQVADIIADESAITSEAVREASAALDDGRVREPMGSFAQLWGRGQQYVSFVKREPVGLANVPHGQG